MTVPLVPHWTPDLLPWGEENRCKAVTRRGKQCKNDIVSGQHHIPGGDKALISERDYRVMDRGLCPTHAVYG